ncbi:MAG TPA: MaoC family dehydratase N-terminal domain-containing protein, partial [Acidimicrobiales bacterium]|nr:MaoC family dehydratase N-terminal domain-containing protein [Acidimicrobiales bacterium]
MQVSNDFRQGEDQAVADLDALLQSFVGKSADAPVLGPDAVNLPMIRHFVEAVGDENPVYIDDEAAVATGRPRLIAPPHMLQTWIMPGLRRKLAGMTGPPSPPDKVYALLEESGFTSIVATNSEQEYHRELEVGDRVRALSTLESVSAEKKTALGRGHFVTTRIDYTTDAGDPVATMLFRVLLYEPAGAAATSGDAPAPKPLTAAGPPRPILTQDNAFFFEQLDEGRLVVQRCADCSVLRHPPQPRCAECG